MIENSHFNHNTMPHIAGKDHAYIALAQCNLTGGKGIFMVDHCQLEVQDTIIKDGVGVQVEVVGHTKATINKSYIRNGQSNGIKVMKDATLHMYDSHVSAHHMPQVIVNDSSIIFKNCELLHGKRNGFIIENHAEAFIQDSFISNHAYPQLWINLDSVVELSATQITEGHESDIYVQNKSTVHATNCIIQNDKFNFNIQAVNHSNIHLNQTKVDNSFGEKFYSENHSQISHTMDDIK